MVPAKMGLTSTNFEVIETERHGARFFNIEQDMHKWFRTVKWLGTTMGKHGGRYYFENGNIFFRDAADLTLFLLKWS
jgi:hypothetical protein